MIQIDNTIKNAYDTSYICLGSKHKGTYIHKSKIIYIESNECYSWLHLSDGTKQLSCKSIGYYEESLHQNNFVRIHRSYLVNISFVNLYEPKYRWVHLKGELILPVSFRRNRKLSKQFKNQESKQLLKIAV